MAEQDSRLPIEVECEDCGHYQCECPESSDPMDYSRAAVVLAFGCTAAFTMWRLVEMNFVLLQAGLPSLIDANIMLECVTFACGTVMGWAFSKRKKGDD